MKCVLETLFAPNYEPLQRVAVELTAICCKEGLIIRAVRKRQVHFMKDSYEPGIVIQGIK